MRLYALIGYPLSHSFSRRYFSEKFAREGIADHAYELFPLERIGELPALLAAHPELRGLNVTIPYKEAVLPYLDELEAEAAAVGAVNTIAIRQGRLTGYNTDVFGFMTSLREWLEETGRAPGAALVLGSGGAAKAVEYGLRQLAIPYRLVSRHPGPNRLTYGEVSPDVLAAHPLVINTTPLGMAPAPDSFPPLPYEALTPQHLLYDLVYNPEKTVFLARGEQRNCLIKNGLDMLYRQAERAWQIWNDPE